MRIHTRVNANGSRIYSRGRTIFGQGAVVLMRRLRLNSEVHSLGSEVLPIRCSSCLYNLTNGIDHKLRLIPLNIVPALFSDDMFTSGRKASQSSLHFQPEFFTFSDHLRNTVISWIDDTMS